MVQRIDIGARLVEERKRLRKNQTDFAAIGGVSKGSQILYEKGDGIPTGDYFALIAADGADIRYILTGAREGPEPISLSADEKVLLDGYRSMDKATQKRMLAFVLGGDITSKQQVFNAEVGQAIKTKKLDQKGISFFGKEKKEK